MASCHGEPRCNEILISLTCIVLVALLVLTVIGNIVTFLAFFKLKHSANNVFFLNLSLMYTVVALLVHPFSIYLIAVQNLTEPSSTVPMVTCQITGVIFETSIYLSLFSLTSVSLDRFVIVFFPLKYKCFVTVKKVYVWITICWIAVFILVIPVAVNHGVNSSDFVVYSTDNSTTVCQGRYWFLESGSDSEGMSYFERHVFVHVVAIIYLILCALSLAPNLAVIVRLNQSMYRTIQRTLSKSTSQLSTQDTTFSNSYLEEKDETPADLISPLRCSDMMKLTGKADSLQSNLVIIPSTAEFKVMPNINKRLSLGDVCKSLSTSTLQSEGSSSAARSGIKTSPSLASLSIAALSAAVPSGSAPICAGVKGMGPFNNAVPSINNLPTPIVRAPSRKRFQATVKSSIKKVSMANTFIIRNQLAVKKTHQVKLRKRRQRSIVITLIIMCLVCLMSSGLYGVAVFSVNLREHHHDSLPTMYVNFYAPFLMFAGMVTIPVIHYWRNAKLKAYIDQQCSVIVLKILPSRKDSVIADSLKKV